VAQSPSLAPGLLTTETAEQFLGVWTFDDGMGGADAQGWTTHDLAIPPGPFFHVDDFAGLGGGLHDGLTPLAGTKSLWCGVRADPAYATAPGYGNLLDDRMESVAFATSGDVDVTFMARYDLDAYYDFAYFDYFSVSGVWQTVFSATSVGDELAAITIPADSVAGSTRLRFRVTSDGILSDEDGFLNTDGALIVDNLTVTDDGGLVDFQDFETEAVDANTTADGDWTASIAQPYGDYSALFDGTTVLQEDPAVTNSTHFWGFFSGSTDDYTCAGHPEQAVVPYTGEIDSRTVGLHNQLWSPPISLTQDIDGNPLSPGPIIMEFDVYRDLSYDALVFYEWAVRSYVGGAWQPWKASPNVYYGANKDWLRHVVHLTDLIAPGATQCQVAIGAVDLCPVWCGSQGTGACHSQSPLVDNVAVFVQGDTLVVTNTGHGAGSLPNALIRANAFPDLNHIVFDIPGAGVHEIVLAESLAVREPVVIDATTQPGYAGAPLIRVATKKEYPYTSAAGGISVLADNCTILGIAFHGDAHSYDAETDFGLRLRSSHNIVHECVVDSFYTGVLLPGTSQYTSSRSASENVIQACTIDACMRGVALTGLAGGLGTNTIGGVLPGEVNVLSDYLTGVFVDSLCVAEIRGNTMAGSIGSGVGIDLYPPGGVTANDPLDVDTGGNGLQNFPVIYCAYAANGTVIGGLASSANHSYTIDLYYADGCNASGYGDGGNYLGSIDVMTDGSGYGLFVFSGSPFPETATVTATATADGKTSEFSKCFSPRIVTNVADSGPGSLRQALLDVNAGEGGTILFDIPGPGPHVIEPLSYLPYLTTCVTIDGYSQPGAAPNSNGPGLGSNAVLKIVLDGSFAAGSVEGLRVSADGCKIRGLAIGNFDGAAIYFDGSNGSEVNGCFLGTDATGLTALPNNTGATFAGGSGNRVGDGTPEGMNVLSGNNHGVGAGGTADLWIQGNIVGLDATGAAALGNANSGLFWLSSSNGHVIDNTISANGVYGISIQGTGTQIVGNRIGTDVSGTLDLGNASHGIYLTSAASGTQPNTLIGQSPSTGNLIAFNGGQGIRVAFPAPPGLDTKADIQYNTLTSNLAGIVVETGTATMLSNSIDNSTALGIDLGNNYVTANDVLDADIGPNLLQNFPTITSTELSGPSSILVSGSLSSEPSSSYRLEFFSSPSCDISGYGEGRTPIGILSPVNTDPGGTAAFAATVANVPGGSRVTATATPLGSTGGTSEFSHCFEHLNTVVGDGVVVIPVDESSGASPVTLTFDHVSIAGNVLLSISSSGPPPPGGFAFNGSTQYFDLGVTATFSGDIELCFGYDDTALAGAASDLKLLHYDDTLIPPDWVDVTTAVDTVSRVVCGVTTSFSPFIVGHLSGATGTGDRPALPETFALHPCAPNPFNPLTTIFYDVQAGAEHVSITVYDVAGRRVRTLVDGVEAAGFRRSVVWDGRDDHGHPVASGVYFYRLVAGKFTQTRKMVLLK
jgi:hypothetical protein